MMSNDDLNKMAKILAVQAEIDGMKAENKDCDLSRVPPAFDLSDFMRKSKSLLDLIS